MLKRDIWNELIRWREREHHPLVIRGLRQIGKTYIVKHFGAAFYDSTVYLDLRAETGLHSAFEDDFDVDRMVMSISAQHSSARFLPGKTLIILDEIQDCPNARSSLKYWDLDGRYDVIATGSFLGVKGYRAPYIRGVPVGYEEQLTMYPLTFHEFLINTGMDQKVLDYVDDLIRRKETVDKAVHESIRALYLQYLIVGGMPEAVMAFFATHDLNEVRRIQRGILDSIRDDFGRYKDDKGQDKVNEVLKLRAEACLDSMPAQLSKEYKKFQYSLVEAKGHSKEKADGLQYLIDVGLVTLAYNTREISCPLEGVKISTEFKAYFTDTGLLISQMGEDMPKKILSGDVSAYKGAIAENMIAAAFSSEGRKLYYYHAPSGSPELDFLFEKNGETIIVECKASNNRPTSMKFVLSKPQKYGVHPAIKIADTNVGGGEGFDTYPLYAIAFLDWSEDSGVITPVDVKNIRVPRKEA